MESRAEAVRQITGITIRETLPDTVLDGADFELVDLPPNELRARLDSQVETGPQAAFRNLQHVGDVWQVGWLLSRAVGDLEAALAGRGGLVGDGHRIHSRLHADACAALDRDPRRAGRAPGGPVDAAVLCAPGGADVALALLEPGGTLLCFADPGAIPAELVYRRELTVVGSRSATPRHMEAAVRLLPRLDLPAPTVFPLERFAEGRDLQRRGEALKVVFVP